MESSWNEAEVSNLISTVVSRWCCVRPHETTDCLAVPTPFWRKMKGNWACAKHNHTIRMRQWFWFSTERQKLPCQFPVEKSASKPRLWQKQKPKPFATVRPLDPQRHPPLAEWGKPHEPSPLRWSSMPLFGMFVDAWWIHTVASDVSAFLPPSPEPASLVQQVLPPVGVKKPRGALEKTTAETAHRDSHGPKTLLRSWLFGSLWIESNFWSFKVCCGIDGPFMDYHGLPIKTDSFL